MIYGSLTSKLKLGLCWIKGILKIQREWFLKEDLVPEWEHL